jgi:hypothetical protein
VCRGEYIVGVFGVLGSNGGDLGLAGAAKVNLSLRRGVGRDAVTAVDTAVETVVVVGVGQGLPPPQGVEALSEWITLGRMGVLLEKGLGELDAALLDRRLICMVCWDARQRIFICEEIGDCMENTSSPNGDVDEHRAEGQGASRAWARAVESEERR